MRLGDGVEIDLASGATVVCDARSPAGDVSVVSHAHADHLFSGDPGDVVCSATTAALASARRDLDPPLRAGSHPDVTLHDAGHVPGSTAAVIEDNGDGSGDGGADGGDGTTYCYTGDVSTRDRLFLSGYDPVDADVLVVESTYGRPEYVFPDHATVESRILDWLADTMAVPVVLCGYALGRAQELTHLAGQSERDRVFVSEGVAAMNAVVADELGIDLDARPFADVLDPDSDASLEPGDAVVMPSGVRRRNGVADLLERTDAVVAGFSGWAAQSSYRYRGGYDETFVLSDHCDFRELIDLVAETDPEVVYTHHGFTDELATHVTRELGIHAQSLKKNQATLDDF